VNTEHFEVVVVGSGAAGSACAARFAEAGKSVLVLEAGPHRDASNLVSSSLWARRLKWSGDPVIERGQDPIGYTFNAGYGTGGSAMHHYAVWPRMHPSDFRLRSDHDRGLDWPFEYPTLQPWYDQVQQHYGISGDAEQEKWRPAGAPYPLPPVPVFAQGELLARGFHRLGMDTAPLPLAITTRPYQDRPACIWDGWCDAGCPTGALANPLMTDLKVAIDNGTELRTSAAVSRILTDDSGQKVTGVEYRDSADSANQVLADLVVLTAFAVENPRLLLASATPKHPTGLANSSGLVGAYMMSHPGVLIYGLFDEPSHCYMGATGGQLVNQDGYLKTRHAERGAFGSYQWMIAQAVKPTDLLGFATTRPYIFGEKLHQFMKSAAHGFATMTALLEDLPSRENRVELSERSNRAGVPLARVTHTTAPETKRLWKAVVHEGEEIFHAAGAREVWHGPQAAMHIMGGTIMGRDPRQSVCNEFGQTHDIANLVIAGSGLFPTSAGVNPTFTVLALTTRSCDYLIRNWNAVKA
jgi:choline dehydrogenase-like flavoprotein